MDKKIILLVVLSILSIVYYIYYYTYDMLTVRISERKNGIEYLGGRRGRIGTEKYVNFNPAPLNYRISTASDQKLTNCPKSLWRKIPNNLKLAKNNNFVISGNQIPITPVISKKDNNSESPGVDGTKNSPKGLFMFAYNQCNPKCCPSTYSCNGGCICTTKEQRRFISTRGSNHSGEDEY